MTRLTEGVPRGAQATPEVLKPFYELWTNSNFQDHFIKSMKADLENFKQAMWNMDFANLHPRDHKTWTEILGLPIPQTDEEFKRCFMALKCCVSYVDWKIGQVERAALQFQKQFEGV
jgi:hypothetical protein